MRAKAKDNLKALGTLMIGRPEVTRAFGAYEGKNAVLALVATGVIDVRVPGNLDVLFSPMAPGSQRPGPEAYAAVTLESLKTKRFPHLTSYQRISKPPGGWKTRDGPKPMLADFTFPDAVIVFLTNGSVREVTPAELASY